ncbi:MAG: PqqD family protein [Bacteroidales bacterium]|nr:PqqD family protein [Bacteroidales bacterium]
MRIDGRAHLREVAGEHVIIVQHAGLTDMSRIVAFNESSRMLFENLKGKDFTREEAASLLCEHYEVDETTAMADAQAWIEQMREQHLIVD